MPVRPVKGSNQSILRAHNERLVLTLLRNHGALSKSQIAKMTGLSAQAAGVIMGHLEAEGFLRRESPRRGRVGQPSVPMSVLAEGAYFLGLKIGRRVTEMVLIDFHGKPVRQVSQPHFCPTPEGTITFALEAVAELLETLDETSRERIAGLGVATPFQLWEWAEQIGAPKETIASWRDQDIGKRLRERFPWPIYLQNDASAACGAELAFARPPEENFLYFFIGSLIGGGVVLNGSLYTGSQGNAGALGSMPVVLADGPGCRTVQLIDVASISSLERKMTDAGVPLAGMRDSTSRWQVPENVLAEWIAEAGEGLAQAILSACAVIDFEAVIIEGGFPSDICARLAASARDRLVTVTHRGIDLPSIRQGAVGANARTLGAASLPLFERFLLSPRTLAASQIGSDS
ncbi:ROK family transcriptional regulator [Notoacmeibacter ruber]|uniref:ROK family transcriptional regulator n=2 Tax=Notoacmeibacter ruber TaxID=2670375 RepID=A0A3L7JFY2_9HYPH|nr:ROK family transcriptional regulator [Notoacmeibacter ruber]